MASRHDSSDGSKTQATPVFLVPQDVLQSWRETNTLSRIDSPLDNVVAKASGAVDNTLREAKASGTDIEQDRTINEQLLRQFGEFMNYKKLRDQQKLYPQGLGFSPSTGNAAPAPQNNDAETVQPYGSAESILKNIPKSYQSKAKKLLHLWTRDPQAMTVNPNSGEISVRGSTVQGSNITQLLKHATSKAKYAQQPQGFHPLKQLTQELDIPEQLVNRAWQRGISPQRPPTPTLADWTDPQIYPPLPSPSSSQDYLTPISQGAREKTATPWGPRIRRTWSESTEGEVERPEDLEFLQMEERLLAREKSQPKKKRKSLLPTPISREKNPPKKSRKTVLPTTPLARQKNSDTPVRRRNLMAGPWHNLRK